MQKLWPLKGSMTLLSLADGFFLLKFSTSEDLEAILSGGPWFLLGKPFILQCWSPKFKPKRDEAAPIPLLIKIVDFPLALWTPTGISRIASYIGVPISVDTLTANRTRLTFARVCVLISKDSELHAEIPIEIDGEDLVLSVLYDWKPDKCEGCGSFIHPFSLCPKNPNPQPVLPPQPSKNRGRSSSTTRLNQTHRSQSRKPQKSVTIDTNLLSTSGLVINNHPDPPMLPQEPAIKEFHPPSTTPPLPNLNSPSEVSSSSDLLAHFGTLQAPNIPLINKFASLQMEESLLSNDDEPSMDIVSSSCSKYADEPPDHSDSDIVPPKHKSTSDKAKSSPKVKPPKGKSAKKAKSSKS
ncbi:uncharacterized protein LOC110110709 [Dendrobium catenatum]|uniref:uncharacterized protein LOC110110709 n=1 Tax=Dendrobium catenatum TaxID=906689 RepID=UPI0009F2684E|nr:uncharacterized protein LOC110110709 [Dendrobium catenatum]